MEQSVNQIHLRGTLHSPPVFSHENHGRQFYRFFLDVPRLSGTSDLLPIIADQHTLETAQIADGTMISVTGQIRSHNHRSNGNRHLLIFAFASSVVCESGPALNEILLEGIICRSPTYRLTPLGREICDVMLAVPRGYRHSDYLPCIFWGRTAKDVSLCNTGDKLQLNGRFQSRCYQKSAETGTEQKTAYEISALNAQIQKDTPSVI